MSKVKMLINELDDKSIYKNGSSYLCDLYLLYSIHKIMQVELNVQMHFGTCKYAENEHAEQNLKLLFCILYKNYTHKLSRSQWYYSMMIQYSHIPRLHGT